MLTVPLGTASTPITHLHHCLAAANLDDSAIRKTIFFALIVAPDVNPVMKNQLMTLNSSREWRQ